MGNVFVLMANSETESDLEVVHELGQIDESFALLASFLLGKLCLVSFSLKMSE